MIFYSFFNLILKIFKHYPDKVLTIIIIGVIFMCYSQFAKINEISNFKQKRPILSRFLSPLVMLWMIGTFVVYFYLLHPERKK